MTKARRIVAGTARTLSLVVFAVALVDCATDAGGPSFITLGVTMTGPSMSSASSGGAGADPANLCVRLPVLLGSRVEKTTTFTSGIGATIVAHREGADVTFPGAEDGSSAHSFTYAELEVGVSEVIAVVADGESFDLRIASGCTNP